MDLRVFYDESQAQPAGRVHTKVVRVRSSIHPSDIGYQQLADMQFRMDGSFDDGDGVVDLDAQEREYKRILAARRARGSIGANIRLASSQDSAAPDSNHASSSFCNPNFEPDSSSVIRNGPERNERTDGESSRALLDYDEYQYSIRPDPARNRPELDRRELYEYSAGEFPLYPGMLDTEEGHFRALLWRHRHPVVVYCLVFWSFGLCVSFLGPTLWDLGCQTGTVLSTMTWVFFSQSLFILIGSMFGGLLVQQFNSNGVLLFSTVGICGTLVGVALATTMPALALTLALMGFCMGLVDTTANVSLLRIFGVDVSPFMQALHFFYGLGAVLSPLIAEPFLQSFDCTLLIDGNDTAYGFVEKMMIEEMKHDKNATHKIWNCNLGFRTAAMLPQTLEEAQERLKIQDVFWTLAFLQIPVILAVVSLIRGSRQRTDEDGDSNYENLDRPRKKPRVEGTGVTKCWVNSTCSFKLIIIVASILLFCSDGVQAAFGGLIYSYGRIDVDEITGNESAYLNAGFWGLFALGRFIAIFAALFMSPGLILFMDIVGALCSLTTFWFFPHGHVALYVGTCMLGLFLSSISPATISLTEQFVDIGPSATSILVVCASAGEMLYPVVIGHMFDFWGPASFVWGVSVSVVLAMVMFLSLWLLGLKEKKPDQGMTSILRDIAPIVGKGKGGGEGVGDPKASYQRFDSPSDPPTPDDDASSQPVQRTSRRVKKRIIYESL